MPIEDTLTLEAYQSYLQEQIGYQFPYLADLPSIKQFAVVGKIWAEKYELLMPFNIRPVTYTYRTGPREGQTETRWVVLGKPGLWGYTSMRKFFEEMRSE